MKGVLLILKVPEGALLIIKIMEGTVLKFWCQFRKIPGPPDVNSGHSNDVTDEIIV